MTRKIPNRKSQVPNRTHSVLGAWDFGFRVERGFTLIELIVSIGLFAIVMTLSSGAYLMMIGINREAQAEATGINNLSFALESMTRDIRTGTGYCGAGTCSASAFEFTDNSGCTVTYALATSASACGGTAIGCVARSVSGTGCTAETSVPITDPSVNISALNFYPVGTSAADALQARVTIVVSGTVSAGPGKTKPFVVETGATMRGTDL